MSDLPPALAETLRVVRRHGPLTAREIADLLRISPRAAAWRVQRLMKRGWLTLAGRAEVGRRGGRPAHLYEAAKPDRDPGPQPQPEPEPSAPADLAPGDPVEVFGDGVWTPGWTFVGWEASRFTEGLELALVAPEGEPQRVERLHPGEVRG